METYIQSKATGHLVFRMYDDGRFDYWGPFLDPIKAYQAAMKNNPTGSYQSNQLFQEEFEDQKKIKPMESNGNLLDQDEISETY